MQRLPGACFRVPLPDGPGGGAHGHSPRGDGPGHDGVGTDDAAITDYGAGEYGHAVAEPDVVTNDDRGGGEQGALCRWGCGIASAGSPIAAMGMVADEHIAAAEEVIAYGDAINTGDVDVVGEPGGMADRETGLKAGDFPGALVRRHSFDPDEVPGVEAGSQVQKAGAQDAGGAGAAEAGSTEAAAPLPVAETPCQGGCQLRGNAQQAVIGGQFAKP